MLPIASRVLSVAEVTSRTQIRGAVPVARFCGRVLFTRKGFPLRVVPWTVAPKAHLGACF